MLEVEPRSRGTDRRCAPSDRKRSEAIHRGTMHRRHAAPRAATRSHLSSAPPLISLDGPPPGRARARALARRAPRRICARADARRLQPDLRGRVRDLRHCRVRAALLLVRRAAAVPRALPPRRGAIRPQSLLRRCAYYHAWRGLISLPLAHPRLTPAPTHPTAGATTATAPSATARRRRASRPCVRRRLTPGRTSPRATGTRAGRRPTSRAPAGASTVGGWASGARTRSRRRRPR